MHGDAFSNFLAELVANDHIEGNAAGITRQVIDRGIESLTQKQRYVFDQEVVPLFPGDCIRGCEMPWEEAYEAMDNGGLCGWCAHMKARQDEDD